MIRFFILFLFVFALGFAFASIPTPTISAKSGEPSSPANIPFVWIEIDFDVFLDDMFLPSSSSYQLSNCTVGSWEPESGDPMYSEKWYAKLTPISEGDVSIRLKENEYQNHLGFDNIQSNLFEFTFDYTKPAAPTGFNATAEDTQISLTWVNATDSDLAGVLILRNTAPISDAPLDSTVYNVNDSIGSSLVVFKGNGISYTDTSLTNGTHYYYAIFSIDGVPLYSGASIADAIPVVGVPAIEVRGSNIVILDGNVTPDPADGTEYGFIQEGTSGAPHMFVIHNTGTGTLTINSVSLSDSNNYHITGLPLTPFDMAPGAEQSFKITFTPLAMGTFNSTVTISNNTVDGSYTFDLSGTGKQTSIQLLDASDNANVKLNAQGNSWLNGGNVGIGTTAPAEKLEVAGKIKAQGVLVTAAAGADFVFDKDYKLKSLLEVEQFIEKYKHLPEIPSAREMRVKGVQIDTFQMKLLQKIEELTLHVIKQNKKMQEQNANIEKLQKRIQELEKNNSSD